MNKVYRYENGKLIVEYKFNDQHLKTLFVVKNNGGYVAFENREVTCENDLEGNEISWMICDELVEMGILVEDELSFDVGYKLIENSDDIINNIVSNI